MKPLEKIHLSLVIPAFNEAGKIALDIQAANDYLAGQDYPSEVLIIDDGSRDETLKVAREVIAKLETKVQFQVLSYGANRGKGYAIRYGIERASGDIIGFVDAGLCVPYSFVEKAMDRLKSGYDFAIASRRTEDAQILQPQPLHRRLGSKVFWKLMKFFMGIRVSDTQCGFKFYCAEAARKIFSRVSTDGFMFDIEALIIARKLEFRGTEFGVEWANDHDTRYHPVKGTLRNLRELVAIRLRTMVEA